MKLFSSLPFLLLATSASAQPAFVPDPTFGSNGIVSYEWPANAYQWDAADLWGARLPDGKLAVLSKLRDGTHEVGRLNWFDPDGTVTVASPGAGAYTPLALGDDPAGLLRSLDGSLSYLRTVSLSAVDTDFQLRRVFPDGGIGYTGCNGGFFQNVAFDQAPPNAMGDVARAIGQDPLGRQILAGTVQVAGGESRIGVARVQPQCGLDTSFNTTGKQVIDPNPYLIFPPPRRARANVVEADTLGRVLIGGGVTFGLNSTDNGACIVVRLGANGQRDPGFGNAGVAYIDSSVTGLPGNFRCDVRGLAVQSDGKIIVSADYALVTGPSTGQRELFVRLSASGMYDPSWSICCTVPFSNAEVRAGGVLLREGDGVVLVSLTTLTNQAGVDDARPELIPLSISDGNYAPGYITNGLAPLGLDSTTYHQLISVSPDQWLVLATSGPDIVTHRRVNVLAYRRASTIVALDRIFANGFNP